MKQIVRDDAVMEKYKKVVDLHVNKYIKATMQHPYGFEHTLRVANEGKTSSQYLVGLLHDIVEDELATWDDVFDTGLSEYELESLVLLTRTAPYDYKSYIKKIADSRNQLAIIVKINDLRDHLRIDRIGTYSESHIKRYTESLYVLLAALRSQL